MKGNVQKSARSVEYPFFTQRHKLNPPNFGKMTHMKKLLLLFVFASLAAGSKAQTLRTPAPSTTQTFRQEFGLSAIEMSYSRPGMKGRKIFGDLVPFGKVWRTGANSATTITLGDTTMIGTAAVPPGKYGLLTIPDQNAWTIIITKQLNVTSPAAYKMENDVVRVTAKPMTIAETIENFTIGISNITGNSCSIDLMWDHTMVSLPVKTDVDSKVMAQINGVMMTDNRPYFAAAQYYADNNKDANQALTWFNKAIEQDQTAFYIYYQKAKLLAKMGRKAEAIETAKKSIELSKAAKNDDYVALNEKLLATLK
jgi:Protein of unknown function (DUF2911)/Tetratricopeptide repeat